MVKAGGGYGRIRAEEALRIPARAVRQRKYQERPGPCCIRTVHWLSVACSSLPVTDFHFSFDFWFVEPELLHPVELSTIWNALRVSLAEGFPHPSLVSGVYLFI